MRLTSEQFLLLQDSLALVLTNVNIAQAIKISNELEDSRLTPFYAKKVYIPNYGPGRKYKKNYGFYFSSEFDVNFFKIKYPRIII